MQSVIHLRARVGLAFLIAFPALAGSTFSVYSDPAGGWGSTVRSAVNNEGDYVGWYENSGAYLGFVHDSTGSSAVVAPSANPSGGTRPQGINSSSDIVGFYESSSGSLHGFVDKSGVYTNLDFPGSSSTQIYGISDNGQIVGYYVDASGGTHGFTEKAGIFTTIDVPGAVATYALGINNAGDMVGSYFDGTELHAFRYHGGTFTTIDYLGAPFTFARDINNSGEIAGWYETCATCLPIGFAGHEGSYTSIEPTPGVPTYVVSINDKGGALVDLIGPGWLSGNSSSIDSGMLTPGDGLPPSVPEPGTSLLMAVGGIILLALGRFRPRS